MRRMNVLNTQEAKPIVLNEVDFYYQEDFEFDLSKDGVYTVDIRISDIAQGHATFTFPTANVIINPSYLENLAGGISLDLATWVRFEGPNASPQFVLTVDTNQASLYFQIVVNQGIVYITDDFEY